LDFNFFYQKASYFLATFTQQMHFVTKARECLYFFTASCLFSVFCEKNIFTLMRRAKEEGVTGPQNFCHFPYF
jgi:hypothetical protein